MTKPEFINSLREKLAFVLGAIALREIVKYSLILLSAVGLSVLTYSFTPLQQVALFLVKGVFNFHQKWMFHSSSFGSWIMSITFLLANLSLLLVSPFVLGIIVLLSAFKPDWLPGDDPSLLKLLNYWLELILLAFAITLMTQLLNR